MDVKGRKATVPWMMMMMASMFVVVFSGSIHPKTSNRDRSSVLLRVSGNVYPLGHYSVLLSVGQPPMEFEFDIDTGSDYIWVQCEPCTGCNKPIHRLYKPKKHLFVRCEHHSCGAVYAPGNPKCLKPSDHCDFHIEYADHSEVHGVWVKDAFSFNLTNGSLIDQRLYFGCGFNLKFSGKYPPPSNDGVVGLSNGEASILSQLERVGVIRNVLGHCLSGKGGGYLFMGDDLVPSGIAWMPLSVASRAELLFGGKPTGKKDLAISFDSGSTYTYFTSHIYEAILDLLKKDLNGKPLEEVDDGALVRCWKGNKPFKSVHEVKKYFSTFTLKFTNTRNVQLKIQPEAYLIVTEHGNACLGILDSSGEGLESNVIGDNSMLDKLVVYDYEKLQIGWESRDCNKLPNLGRNYKDEL